MSEVKMTPVESSNVEAIGYDPEGRTLHVRFKGSGVYKYGGVLPSEHARLMAAESKGRHLREHIIGKYGHVKG